MIRMLILSLLLTVMKLNAYWYVSYTEQVPNEVDIENLTNAFTFHNKRDYTLEVIDTGLYSSIVEDKRTLKEYVIKSFKSKMDATLFSYRMTNHIPCAGIILENKNLVIKLK